MTLDELNPNDARHASPCRHGVYYTACEGPMPPGFVSTARRMLREALAVDSAYFALYWLARLVSSNYRPEEPQS